MSRLLIQCPSMRAVGQEAGSLFEETEATLPQLNISNLPGQLNMWTDSIRPSTFFKIICQMDVGVGVCN